MFSQKLEMGGLTVLKMCSYLYYNSFFCSDATHTDDIARNSQRPVKQTNFISIKIGDKYSQPLHVPSDIFLRSTIKTNSSKLRSWVQIPSWSRYCFWLSVVIAEILWMLIPFIKFNFNPALGIISICALLKWIIYITVQ